ncbi:MAG: hypothetical protein R3F39_10435 [Myxococcota bacterium]
MLLLLASLAALLAGPLIVRAFGASHALLSLLDAFVITSITGLVFLEVLPSALVGAGLWPVAAAVVGLWLPRGLEHVLEGRRTEGRGRALLVVAALVGLAIHAMLDGAALAPTAAAHEHGHVPGTGDWGLGLSVILHRIPFGLVIWWTVRPRHGVLPAAGLLVLIATATVGGYALGQIGVRELPTTALLTFQALVAGALLHIVFEHPVDDPTGEARKPSDNHVPAGLGALSGAALVVAVILLHGDAHGAGEHAHSDPAGAALELALRLAPALLLGLGLVVAASQLRPAAAAPLRFLRGALAGARTLPRLAAPDKAPPAHAIAASVLGLDVVLASWAAFGAGMTALRGGAAALVALLLAAVSTRWAAAAPAPIDTANAPPPGTAPTARAAVAQALDRGIPWVAFGLLTAGLAQAALPADSLATLSAPASLALALVLAWPAYLCGLGLTPIVLVMLGAGFAPGAALVMLILAPAAHPAALAHLAAGRRLAHRSMTALLALTAGVLTYTLWTPAIDRAAHAHEPSLTLLAEHPLNALALALLLALAAARLLQRGPRALLAELTPGGGLHRHHPHLGGARAPAAILGGFSASDHDHGHDHHHHDH